MPFLHREGVALHFETRQGGGRPIILIYGWCCDRTYLGPQAEYFADLGHQVVFPDLRGHGLSDKPEQAYPIKVRNRIIVPAVYIAANEPSPRSDMQRLKELIPHLSSGQTVGSGHFCQLEVPEQLDAMIARFLTVALELTWPRPGAAPVQISK